MGLVLNKYKVKQFLLFFLNIVLMPAYAIHAWVGVEFQIVFFVVTIASLILVLEERVLVEQKYIVLIVVVVVVGFIGTVLSLYKAQVLMGLSLGLTCFVVISGRKYIYSEGFLRYVLIYMWMLLLGALIGFIYYSFGGREIGLIDIYQDGSQIMKLYLTTYADYNGYGLMRPSGLFDEPGALAMFVTMAICLNEVVGGNKYNSLLALILGLVTGSLILFLIFIVYLFFGDKRRGWLFYLVVILIVGYVYYSFYDILNAFFFRRLVYGEEGFAGDNRSGQVVDFFRIVDFDIFIKGAVASNKDAMIDQSSNPFSILYGYGFLMWLIYMALELYLLYVFFKMNKRVRFAGLALFLTLLQRPYLFNFYWAFMIVMVVYGIALFGRGSEFLSNSQKKMPGYFEKKQQVWQSS